MSKAEIEIIQPPSGRQVAKRMADDDVALAAFGAQIDQVFRRAGVRPGLVGFVREDGSPADLKVISVENLEAMGPLFKSAQDSYAWNVGEWACAVKDKAPDRYEAAARATGEAPGTIEQWAYAVRNIPYKERIPGMSIGHHKVLASLPPVARRLALREVAQVSEAKGSVPRRVEVQEIADRHRPEPRMQILEPASQERVWHQFHFSHPPPEAGESPKSFETKVIAATRKALGAYLEIGKATRVKAEQAQRRKVKKQKPPKKKPVNIPRGKPGKKPAEPIKRGSVPAGMLLKPKDRKRILEGD